MNGGVNREVIKLTETSSQDQIWLRTLEQFLDETRHDHDSVRGSVN